MKNNIYIIGAGAIGKVLAVFLKRNNANVTLLRGSVDNKSSTKETIRVVLPDRTELEAEIEVSTLSNFSELDGIIVLTTKSYGNENIAQALKGKVNNSPIVILQNGLGVEEVFNSDNFTEVFRCVLFATSQNISENKLSFKPVSVSPIGIIKGTNATLNKVVELISSSNFQFKAESDIQPVIWKKAIVNSVFNSICPLLEIDNGIFYRDEGVLQIAKRIIRECVLISTANGVSLSVDQVIESLVLISKASDGQFISTLQDIRKKRKTEIETLNFEIVRIAATLGKENLVTETKLLGELIKIKSELAR